GCLLPPWHPSGKPLAGLFHVEQFLPAVSVFGLPVVVTISGATLPCCAVWAFASSFAASHCVASARLLQPCAVGRSVPRLFHVEQFAPDASIIKAKQSRCFVARLFLTARKIDA